MEKIPLFEQFITLLEKKGDTFSYGCVMIFVSFPPEIKELHKKIDEKDLYVKDGDRSFGIEDAPHATILYGVHKEVKSNEITKLIEDIDYKKLKIHNLSIFDNDDYDVLKFDVKAPALIKANKKLTDNVPFTSDFDSYHPHLTIAYMKKGTAKKLIKEYDGLEFFVEPTKIVYSSPNNKKKTLIKFD